MGRRKLAMLLPLCLVALAAPAAAKEINKGFHQAFDVQPGARLRLQHGDGDVTVTAWDRDMIDVTVRYRVTVTKIGLGSDPDFDVEFWQSGRTVHVSGRETGGTGVFIGFHSERHEYTYRIQAPSYVELDFRGDDGDVGIEGWRGAIEGASDDGNLTLTDIRSPRTRLELGDGDLRLDGLHGGLFVENDDGDVELSDCHLLGGRISQDDGDVILSRCEGDLEIVVDDGEVQLDEHGAGELKIRSGDGDVEVHLLRSGGIDLDIEADEGNVIVTLEPGTAAVFTIRTGDGRIVLDLPGAENLEQEKHRASGELHGGGEGSIRIRTEDGDVTLRENK